MNATVIQRAILFCCALVLAFACSSYQRRIAHLEAEFEIATRARATCREQLTSAQDAAERALEIARQVERLCQKSREVQR